MFDKLVESTNEKKQGRAGRIFFLTALVYAMLLSGAAVTTILGLNPALADALSVKALVAPPPPPGPPIPQPTRAQLTEAPTTAPATVVPKDPPEVANLETIQKFAKLPPKVVLAGLRNCPGCVAGGSPDASIVGGVGEAPPEPPPAVKAKPTPEPAPEPTPARIVKVSEISPGLVLRRVSPQYPPLAKAARIQGAVHVQVLISEEGRVMSDQTVSGHPMLRAAAEDAARQWVFKPTTLNGVPVKVQGILTFNFTLN